jgi:hypothetical protein
MRPRAASSTAASQVLAERSRYSDDQSAGIT